MIFTEYEPFTIRTNAFGWMQAALRPINGPLNLEA